MFATGKRRGMASKFLPWLCGGALAINLLMAVGLIVLIGAHGLAYFWQRPLAQMNLADGGVVIGEIIASEEVPAETAAHPGEKRLRVKIGNRDINGLDFRWLRESEIGEISYPPDLVLLERLEWGDFYGRMKQVNRGGQVVARRAAEVAATFADFFAEKKKQRHETEDFERGEIKAINHEIEELRLKRRRAELAGAGASEFAAIDQAVAERQSTYDELATRLFAMRRELLDASVIMTAAGGIEKEIAIGQVVRSVRPNALGFFSSIRLYLSRVWELISDTPRESNTEGGIFPAIFGTVMMVFIMSFAVAPFGVLAALYLREYAREGPVVRAVRIAVNNLAGVPSIVFGVFGLGFFVYGVGGTIDQLFYAESLPTPTYGTGGILWASLTLALLTVPVVIVAAEEGLAAVPRIVREGSLALGATKLETIWKVVLPAAAPGILTGMILAMARAAGEVAPLMIVGMVKLAPSLPIDSYFPYVHLERKFMHLGFHVYDVGFQSPNVEAAQPLVFATALLLVAVVIAMNLVAILVRNRLRRIYAGSAI